jgi:hypothetical protein
MADNTILTPDHVQKVMLDCLFREDEIDDGEIPADAVKAEGIINTYAFHPARLASHAQEIATMLDQLPDEFKRSGGGGWSFLNACVAKDPDDPDKPFEDLAQWTGLHRVMEELMCLGIATGRVKIQVPRALWGSFPAACPTS